MKLSAYPSVSPLVSTEHGVGFLDPLTREVRKAFGVHVAPEPKNVRPATADEARAYFEARMFHRVELTAYYDRATNTGD